VPADAHLRALAVGDDHTTRLADRLLGHAEEACLQLGRHVRFVVTADHLVEQEGLPLGIGVELGIHARPLCLVKAVLMDDGADLACRVVSVVLEPAADGLHLRLGEENGLALAIEEEARRVATFARVVLHAQPAGGDDVGAPGVQAHRAHALAPEHPRRPQHQVLVQGQGGADPVQFLDRDHVRIAPVQDLHHVQAVAQQSRRPDTLELRHLQITRRHAADGTDQIARPDVVALVHRLVHIAQFVEIVR